MHISVEVPACGQKRPAFILRSIGSVDEKCYLNSLQSAAIAELYSTKTTCPQELQQIEESKMMRNEEKAENFLQFQKKVFDWGNVDVDWQAFMTLRSMAAGGGKFLGGKMVLPEEIFLQYSTWLLRRVNNLWNHGLLGVCDGHPVGWLVVGGYSPHVIKLKDKTGTFVDASQDERYQAVFGGSRHRKELAGWLKEDHKGKGLGMRALQALIYEILPKLDPPPSWETELILTIPSENTRGISKLETLGFEEVQPPAAGDAFYRKTGDSSDAYSSRRVYVFRVHQVLSENNSPPIGARSEVVGALPSSPRCCCWQGLRYLHARSDPCSCWRAAPCLLLRHCDLPLFWPF
jgi:GNAT superfamily N-acetyltransferase